MMKKLFSIAACLCLVAGALTGCGSPKASPEDSAMALFDLYILRDTASAQEIGLPTDVLESALQTMDSATEETLKDNLATAGLTISDEKLSKIIDARKEAMKKLSASAQVSEKPDKNSAVVTLSVTWYDETALDTAAAEKALEVVQSENLTDVDEALERATELYADNLVEAYQNVEIQEGTREVQAVFVVTDNQFWFPENPSSFGYDLGSTVCGLSS